VLLAERVAVLVQGGGGVGGLVGSTPIITGMQAPSVRASRWHQEGRPTLAGADLCGATPGRVPGRTAQPFSSQPDGGSGACGATCRHPGTYGLQPQSSYPHSISRRRFRLWSRRSRVTAPGSRWAATGVRNDRGAHSQTVEDHDRRFARGRPLTWSFHPLSRSSTAWSSMGRRPAQISHGGSQGFKSPHLHPTTQQLRASSVHHRRRSCRRRRRLGPHWGHARAARRPGRRHRHPGRQPGVRE
jgi:hypothetical protein